MAAGDGDIAKAKQDFSDLYEMTKALNERSEGTVLKHAWHTQPINILERVTTVIKGTGPRRYWLNSSVWQPGVTMVFFESVEDFVVVPGAVFSSW
jgi:hypothetical protein